MPPMNDQEFQQAAQTLLKNVPPQVRRELNNVLNYSLFGRELSIRNLQQELQTAQQQAGRVPNLEQTNQRLEAALQEAQRRTQQAQAEHQQTEQTRRFERRAAQEREAQLREDLEQARQTLEMKESELTDHWTEVRQCQQALALSHSTVKNLDGELLEMNMARLGEMFYRQQAHRRKRLIRALALALTLFVSLHWLAAHLFATGQTTLNAALQLENDARRTENAMQAQVICTMQAQLKTPLAVKLPCPNFASRSVTLPR